VPSTIDNPGVIADAAGQAFDCKKSGKFSVHYQVTFRLLEIPAVTDIEIFASSFIILNCASGIDLFNPSLALQVYRVVQAVIQPEAWPDLLLISSKDIVLVV